MEGVGFEYFIGKHKIMLDIKLIYDPNVYVGHKCGCNE